MSPADAVTIVIPCRNEAASIAEVLDSVLAQDLDRIDWEMIVADGMSDDGTRAILESYAAREPRIRILDNPARAVPAGLNSAIRAARGEIILRMDAHTAYAPDYVRRCLDTLHETGAANVGGPARTKPRGYWGRAIAAAYHSPVACGGARFHDPNYEGWADTVPYGCWRKSTLLEIGLFDETLVRNQDDELNLRLCRAGGRVWQSPAIVSWYQPRASLRRLFQQYFQYGFWKVAVIRKHRIPASVRHLIPATFVAAAALLPVAALLLRSPFVIGAWAAMLAVYFVAIFAASVDSARRYGWDLLAVLPIVFAAYHFSYGSGFLLGLLQSSPTPVFTKVTR
jgi:glycosyltransferase involved in cell wall biosynthesis